MPSLINEEVSELQKDKKKKKKSLKNQSEKNDQSTEEIKSKKKRNREEKESKGEKKKKKQKSDEESNEENKLIQSKSGDQKETKKDKSNKKKKHSTKEKVEGNSSGLTNPFYVEHPSLSQVSSEDVEQFRKEKGIKVIVPEASSNPACLKPIRNFSEANIPNSYLEYCKQKFLKPTPIQSQCWPILFGRSDLIAIAETGSGKTLAFLLPALLHVHHQQTNRLNPKQNPVTLILAPTRELASQISTVAEEIGASCGVGSLCLYGGMEKSVQKNGLKYGTKNGKPQVIVATPGRLLDLIQSHSCVVDNISFLVLDEADRMLDAGFEDDIRRIVSYLPSHPKRHTVVFSATWPPEVRALGNSLLVQPLTVSVTKNVQQNDSSSLLPSDQTCDAPSSEQDDDHFTLRANKAVTQVVEVLEDNNFVKDQKLQTVLLHYQNVHQQTKKGLPWRVLVFVLYKKDVSRVENFVRRRGWSVASISGDMSQDSRFKNLNLFKAGKCQLLVATDVAARGLDIPDVSVVINYSFPLTIADYIHRIGRTGRAGNAGLSHTFFTSFDRAHSGELVNVLRDANQEVPADLLKFGTSIKRKEHTFYGAHYKDRSNSAAPVASAPKHITFD